MFIRTAIIINLLLFGSGASLGFSDGPLIKAFAKDRFVDICTTLLRKNGTTYAQPVNVKYPFVQGLYSEGRVANLVEGDPELVLLSDDPEFQTSLLTAPPNLFNDSKGIMVMLPGMGGSVEKYGVEATAAPFNRMAMKNGFFPIAIQNWVYYGTGRLKFEESQRERVRRRYSKIGNQMKAVARSLTMITKSAGTTPDGESRKVWVTGRSNGSGLLLEFLSRASRGDKKAYRVATQLEGVVVAGLNSPEPDAMEGWTGLEDELERKEPGTLDPFAKIADRNLYSQMTWTKKAPNSAKNDAGIPPVVAIISSQDEYISVRSQIQTMTTFAKLHPSIPVVLVYSDLGHDPVRSIDYRYQMSTMKNSKRLQISPGTRFWEIFTRAFLDSNCLTENLTAGQPNHFYLPEFFYSQWILPKKQ